MKFSGLFTKVIFSAVKGQGGAVLAFASKEELTYHRYGNKVGSGLKKRRFTDIIYIWRPIDHYLLTSN